MDRGMMGLLRSNNSGEQPPKDHRSLKLMATGMTLIGFLGLISVFAPALMSSLFAVPIMMITVLLAIALFVNILSSAASKNTAEKQKRALAGLDMYSMIDRLVDDLDEEELAHLRRRLEEREQGRDRKLTQSLEALLDERSESRQ